MVKGGITKFLSHHSAEDAAWNSGSTFWADSNLKTPNQRQSCISRKSDCEIDITGLRNRFL